MSALRWLTSLAESLSRARGEADAVLVELAQRLGERCAFPLRAAARFEGTTLRCLLAAGEAPFGAGAVIGDSELARFYSHGTVERLHGVRIGREGETVRLVVELKHPHRRVGAVLLGREGALASDELELIVAAARVAELAAQSPPASPPSSIERSAEHWEAIGRLTSTVLHELGNPVAFAALAATQLAREPGASEQARMLAEELASSVKQMSELLSELRRVARGPEGASFVEPRAIVEGAIRLTQAELRGAATIDAAIGELPLVPGRIGSLGAGLAHLFSTVLRGFGGALRIRGSVNDPTAEVVLTVEGYDFRMPRAHDPVRIVRAIAASAEGRAELGKDGSLLVFLPIVREPQPPSSRRALARPRLLVIEDEQALARALAAALGTSFEVVVATTAEEALDRVDQGAFEAVLCDVHLADTSGLQLYEKIVLRAPALAHRFALTSGGLDRATEESARVRGLPVLTKPFDWPLLERELERLVADESSP